MIYEVTDKITLEKYGVIADTEAQAVATLIDAEIIEAVTPITIRKIS
jgi:hypothetical protein